MSEQPQQKDFKGAQTFDQQGPRPFFFGRNNTIDDLERWLGDREFNAVRDMKDKKGNPMLGLQMQDVTGERPPQQRGLIVVLEHGEASKIKDMLEQRIA